MATSMSYILSSALKYQGLVKDWRRHELAQKQPQAVEKSQRSRSQSPNCSPPAIREGVDHYSIYASRKIAEWLSHPYLSSEQQSQGLTFVELSQYMLDIGFSRGLEDEALLLKVYLMFLNRPRSGASSKAKSHTKDPEAFS